MKTYLLLGICVVILACGDERATTANISDASIDVSLATSDQLIDLLDVDRVLAGDWSDQRCSERHLKKFSYRQVDGRMPDGSSYELRAYRDAKGNLVMIELTRGWGDGQHIDVSLQLSSDQLLIQGTNRASEQYSAKAMPLGRQVVGAAQRSFEVPCDAVAS